MTLIHIE